MPKMVVDVATCLCLLVLPKMVSPLQPMPEKGIDGVPIIHAAKAKKDRRHRSFNAITLQYGSLDKRNSAHKVGARSILQENYAAVAIHQCPPPEFMWEKTYGLGDPFASTEKERKGEMFFQHLLDPLLTQFYEPVEGWSTAGKRHRESTD